MNWQRGKIVYLDFILRDSWMSYALLTENFYYFLDYILCYFQVKMLLLVNLNFNAHPSHGIHIMAAICWLTFFGRLLRNVSTWSILPSLICKSLQLLTVKLEGVKTAGGIFYLLFLVITMDGILLLHSTSFYHLAPTLLILQIHDMQSTNKLWHFPY